MDFDTDCLVAVDFGKLIITSSKEFASSKFIFDAFCSDQQASLELGQALNIGSSENLEYLHIKSSYLIC